MGHLTITFAGICTHYRNIVPDVPHRVVLPDGGAFRFGLLQQTSLPNIPGPVAYYVQPHFAIVQTSTSGFSQTVEGIMETGYLYAGAHVTVPNATTPLAYDPAFDQQIASLADFVPEFRYSSDVVLGGKAMCYFDLHHGLIHPHTSLGGAKSVTVEMDTTGPPVLRLTPFASGAEAFELLLLDEEPAVVVANVEFKAGTATVPPTQVHEAVPFDFLLHYLSATRGIPQILVSPTPGLDRYDGQPLTTQRIKDALDALGELLSEANPDGTATHLGPSAEMVRKFDFHQLDPSCSDSRYP